MNDVVNISTAAWIDHRLMKAGRFLEDGEVAEAEDRLSTAREEFRELVKELLDEVDLADCRLRHGQSKLARYAKSQGVERQAFDKIGGARESLAMIRSRLVCEVGGIVRGQVVPEAAAVRSGVPIAGGEPRRDLPVNRGEEVAADRSHEC